MEKSELVVKLKSMNKESSEQKDSYKSYDVEERQYENGKMDAIEEVLGLLGEKP